MASERSKMVAGLVQEAARKSELMGELQAVEGLLEECARGDITAITLQIERRGQASYHFGVPMGIHSALPLQVFRRERLGDALVGVLSNYRVDLCVELGVTAETPDEAPFEPAPAKPELPPIQLKPGDPPVRLAGSES